MFEKWRRSLLVRYVLPALSWLIAYRNRNTNEHEDATQPVRVVGLILFGAWLGMWSLGAPSLLILIYLSTMTTILTV